MQAELMGKMSFCEVHQPTGRAVCFKILTWSKIKGITLEMRSYPIQVENLKLRAGSPRWKLLAVTNGRSKVIVQKEVDGGCVLPLKCQFEPTVWLKISFLRIPRRSKKFQLEYLQLNSLKFTIGRAVFKKDFRGIGFELGIFQLNSLNFI